MQGRRQKVTDKQIELALYKTSGILAQAAAVLSSSIGEKITRQAIWRRVKRSKKLQQAQLDAREQIIDLAESVVTKALLDGNWKVAVNVLKTLGKERGYCERQELTGGNGPPIEVQSQRKVQVQIYLPDNGRGDDDV